MEMKIDVIAMMTEDLKRLGREVEKSVGLGGGREYFFAREVDLFCRRWQSWANLAYTTIVESKKAAA